MINTVMFYRDFFDSLRIQNIIEYFMSITYPNIHPDRSRLVTRTSNPANIYKEEFIIEICELLQQGYRPAEVCRMLGYTDLYEKDSVIFGMIRRIFNRQNWISISSKYNW